MTIRKSMIATAFTVSIIFGFTAPASAGEYSCQVQGGNHKIMQCVGPHHTSCAKALTEAFGGEYGGVFYCKPSRLTPEARAMISASK